MNPYIIGGAALALAVSGFTAGWKVSNWRHDSNALLIERAAKAAGDATTEAAVTTLKGLRPQFTTINKGIEKEFRSEVRYTSPDCSHTPASWGLLDRAYQAAGGEPFDSGIGLPDANSAAGSNAGRDDASPDRGVGSTR